MAKKHCYRDIMDMIGDGMDSELSGLSDDDDDDDIDEDGVFPRSELDKILKEIEEAELSVFKPIEESDDDLFIEANEPSSTNSVSQPSTTLFSEEDKSFNDEFTQQFKRSPALQFTPRCIPNDQTPTVNLPFVQNTDIQWTNKPFMSKPLNVQALVPEISTTHQTLSPIEYFMNYFPEVEFENMAKYTNLNAKEKCIENYVDTTPGEIKVFVGIHLIIGCFKNPCFHLYWKDNFRINGIADNMSLDRFLILRSCFHVIDNNNIPTNNVDTFITIRPLYNSFLNQCKKLPVETNLAAGKQKIVFNGELDELYYNMEDKPCPWGIKTFILCSQNGIVYNMILYQENMIELNPEIQNKYGLGGSVVLKLVEHLEMDKHILFFDHFFGSYNLFMSLDYLGIKAAGLVNINSFAKPPILSNRELKKLGRGASYEVSSTDEKIGVIKWFDKKTITLASNFITSGQSDKIERYDRKKKSYIEVSRPEIVKLYNDTIRGVFINDHLTSIYRVFLKSQEWTLHMLFHFFDMGICNSWLEYTNDAQATNLPKKNTMDLFSFKQKLAETLITVGNAEIAPRKFESPILSPKPTIQPKYVSTNCEDDSSNSPDELRYDHINHLPEFDDLKDATLCKNEGCSKKSHTTCTKCNVHLCMTKKRNCFYEYHHQ
ncbi:unnamed protein product [Macrosiphum euphorbiae]|uniref:PiggyBac transposable element-derived protein domain-containing protein n=1 Tax=Macrosiphum euphorbiae TaxID=13131 RepID=A0AAV0W0P6_9HEMI|nr:unnamed protein product [Macrosiphum euphorbiae]